MLRIQVLSDPHIDVAPLAHPIRTTEGADVVVVAGDICEGAREGFKWIRKQFPAPIKLITVFGNHTFYRRTYDIEVAEAKAAAAELDIILLDDDVVEIDGVRIVGGTLWTDYRLYGEAFALAAFDACRTGMNDHRRIKWRKQPWQRFRPQEALALHTKTRAFIEDVLAVPFDGPTVVVTHHAPSPKSVHEKYGASLVNAAYASDLEPLIARHQPDLWIHGHIHTSADYQLGETRVLANPHGYGDENPRFDPDLVVELARAPAPAPV